MDKKNATLEEGPAWLERSDRSLIVITGKDRAGWLHNLTTNQVKTLECRGGNYAFCLNIQGRILFDLNALVHEDRIWVDIDRRFLERAMKHFQKYIIMEDVAIADHSPEFLRFGLFGRRAAELMTAWAVSNALAMPQLGFTRVPRFDDPVWMLRHDFCGPFGVELFVATMLADQVRGEFARDQYGLQLVPVSAEAVQTRRIEAGIPWSGHEITDEYVPAETRQLDRAVSSQKGCYLGQEVVERMRARHVVARQLVGLKIEGTEVPPPGAALSDSTGKAVGSVTSSCLSQALGRPIALGYVRTALSQPGTTLTAQGNGHTVTTTVVELPFVA